MKTTYFVANPNLWITDHVPQCDDMRQVDVALEVTGGTVAEVAALAKVALATGLRVLVWAVRDTQDWLSMRPVINALLYGEAVR